ncbi:MAG: hypothetical protein WA081_20105 [Desulfosalsimonadaceae bacterium]
MNTPVKFDDLLSVYEWVSAAGQFQNSAFVNKVTGKIHIDSDDVDEDEDDALPDDYEDAVIYVAVPHKNDLDMGRYLAIRYIDENLPESADDVRRFFRKRGAYSRFKDLLQRKGVLDAWYQYEARAVEAALREWAKDNDLDVESD